MLKLPGLRRKAARRDRDWWLVFLMTVGALAALLLIAFRSRFNDGQLDAFSYISLAEQYADGSLSTAINAYWSPLITWLMVPLIKLGVSGHLAFALVNWLAAGMILQLGTRLVWRHTKRHVGATLLFIATISPLLAHGIEIMTPDLLTAAVAMLLLTTLLSLDERLRGRAASDRRTIVRAAILLGLVGALCYYTKLFLLPFFVASVGAWAVARALSQTKRWTKLLNWQSAREYLTVPVLAGLVMLVLMAPWVAMLSTKYDKLTAGSSFSSHISRRVQPTGGAAAPRAETPGAKTYPLLQAPPNDRALSSRENFVPGNTAPAAKMSKKAQLKYFVSERVRVFPLYLAAVLRVFPAMLVIMTALFAAWLFGRLKYKDDASLLLPGMLFAVYFVGYAAVTVSLQPGDGGPARYYWPLAIFSMLTVALALPRLWGALRRQERWRHWLLAAILLTLPLLTAKTYVDNLERLVRSPRQSREYALSEQIKAAGVVPEGSKLAGNNRRVLIGFAYYLDSQTFGSIDTSQFASPPVQQALKENDIDYFFHFQPAADKTEIGVGAVGAEIVKTVEIPRYTCRDIRYGGSRGAGVQPEECVLRIIKLP